MCKGYDLCYAKAEGLLGAGHYSTLMSSKSISYSNNEGDGKGSKYKAVMTNAVSLGRVYETSTYMKYTTKPPPGFSSVFAVGGTNFGNDELVVYDDHALRPAFLIICDKLEITTFPDKPDYEDLARCCALSAEMNVDDGSDSWLEQ
ncbi:hypothetical protein FRB93_011005 [Tulasnella sp. JGI-2019a]|nr:hypothetical protein FRB93_011005 [Tulasnella sp. JGI-2019a]